MNRLFFSLAALLYLMGLRVAEAQEQFDPAARVAAVADLLDDATVAVGHADLSKIDFVAAVKFFLENIPIASKAEQAQISDSLAVATNVRTQLLAAGAVDWYVIARYEGGGTPPAPPVVVIVVKKGKDPQAVVQILQGLAPLPPIVKGNQVLLTEPAAAESLNAIQPKPRADFVQAFQAAGNTAAQLVFIPNQSVRQVPLGVSPQLQAAGPAITTLTQKLQWVAVTLNTPPNLAVALIVQLEDRDAADVILSGMKLALDMGRKQEQLKQAVPNLDQLAELFTPKLKGDNQLRIVITENNGGVKAITGAVVPAILAARKAAEGTRSINNLKQIGLAMHNYHDTHRRFPAQASASKDGKKLLSWRVELLPFLDAVDLYQQFHLDEPWDSEHNLKLVEQMPPAFVSPNLPPELLAKGMTNYLAPITKGSIFGGSEGISMAQITDGTSNTIMAVEAAPAKAVIWTKPDDLQVDEKDPLQGLAGQPAASFNALFCDGACRVIRDTIDPKTLWLLFLMNDGQTIGEF